MNDLTEQFLHKYCHSKNIFLTQHLQLRCVERSINFSDVKNVIQTGNVIETYPTDYPFPSCLILGKTLRNKPLHVVCGTNDGIIYVITAYYPTKDKWDNDYTTRKEK